MNLPGRTSFLDIVAAAVFGVICGACSVQPQQTEDEEPHGVDVIAHRGASAYAPENTLAAFRLAAEMGADWFELDCTLSKDGEVVVIHDDTLGRTTPLTGRVDAYDAAALRRTDAGSWFDPQFAGECIPTLADALDVAGDRIGVYVEIKSFGDDRALQVKVLELLEKRQTSARELDDEVIRAVEDDGTRNLALTRAVIREIQTGPAKRVVIQSFSPIICAVAQIEAPEMRVELLGSSSDDDPKRWPDYLRWVDALDVAGFNVNMKDVTSDLIEAMHAAGRAVTVWTINDEADMRRFIAMGADGLITDHPDAALRVVDLVD